MQEYPGRYCQMGKNATTDEAKELSHSLTASATVKCRELLDVYYCLTMTPQAILGPPGASFVGGSGRYLS